jgi:hypothetical protein
MMPWKADNRIVLLAHLPELPRSCSNEEFYEEGYPIVSKLMYSQMITRISAPEPFLVAPHSKRPSDTTNHDL